MADTAPSNIVSLDEVTEKTEIDHQVNQVILKESYRYCRVITKQHYENFPVASKLLPRKIRPAIEAIYAFSRTADDFADEQPYFGQRIQKLKEWENFLMDTGCPSHPIFIALHDSIQKHGLPIPLFTNLLKAFTQDVQKKRYQNFAEILGYCKNSANPVGALVLHLFDQATQEHLKMSDAICTGLQLANFWQDIAIDLIKDRIYLPLDELDKFSVNVDDLFKHMCNESFKRLLYFQIERTQDIFYQGKNLGLSLPGKLGLEIRLTWLGGMTILKKIKEAGYDIFRSRPTLTKSDFMKLFFIALSKKRYAQYE